MLSVLVIGAGFMGSGIAQVCAQAGYEVHLMDVNKESLLSAQKGIDWSLAKLAERGSIGESPVAVSERISLETDLEAARHAQWVIECAVEIEEVKEEIFKELDSLASDQTPLASNTSTIPITRIARSTSHPHRVLGLHFFGPVPMMGLVEVVKGEDAAEEVYEQGVAFVRSLGKTPVCVKQDIPAFVMNRIFSAAFREAIGLVERDVVTVEDVDIGMRLGYGWSAGPFEIADNAGLDTFALIADSLKKLGEDHLVFDSDLIDRMVKDGRLGRKAGKGFYQYTSEGKRKPREDKP